MVARTGPSSAVVDAVLERAQYSCEACGVLVGDRRGIDWSVQHRRPRGMGGTKWKGTNLPSNLMILCGSATTGCHGFTESNRESALAAGWLVPQSLDPLVVPAMVCKRWVLLTDTATYKPYQRFDVVCACSHLVTSHHLTPGKKRTYCRVTTMLGGCGCKLFEETP